MPIRLATSSKIVLDSMCTILIVFCDIRRHSITQHVLYQIIENLQYDIVLGIDWLKSTNPIIDWVA